VKSDISVFFFNLSRKFKLPRNLTRITGTLHEHQYKFMIISRSVLLRIRNVSNKLVQKIEIYFAFNNYF